MANKMHVTCPNLKSLIIFSVKNLTGRQTLQIKAGDRWSPNDFKRNANAPNQTQFLKQFGLMCYQNLFCFHGLPHYFQHLAN